MSKTFKRVKKRSFALWTKLRKIPTGRLILGAIAFLILAVAVSGGGFILLVRSGAFGQLPSYGELRNIQNNVASEVYSADGKLIGKFYIQERTQTDLDHISPHLIDALIATEDVRFFNHNGVDYHSLARVLIKSILLQNESSGGGSTITQQLAKNLYPRRNHGWLTLPVNKTKEVLTARRIEKIYSKNEILELYLNTVSFGDNAFGIETAAERYFSVDPDELTIEQSAVLVGMLKATYNYNPRVNPEAAIQRRNLVLDQMKKYKFLTDSMAGKLKEVPLQLKYTNPTHDEGLAPYFREYLRTNISSLLQTIEKPGGGGYNLYTDGLKIYTTIDSRMQRYAEEAMREHMKRLQKTFYMHWGSARPWYKNNDVYLNAIFRSDRYKKLKAEGLSEEEIQTEFKKEIPMKIFTWEGEEEKLMSPLDSVRHYLYFLNAGLLAMEPSTGYIKAWVGGINHRYFKYDHVNINTKRQVGSTFKPIVYASALEQGFDPCEYLVNEQTIYEEYEDWSPRNANGEYTGYYSMEGALANSVNTISVNLLMESGLRNTIKLAHNLGIESKVPGVPSIALGTPSISLYEMTAAYSAFVNEGRTVKPRYLTKIEDARGKAIYENESPGESRKILSDRTVEIMLEMLQNVINNGTGAKLRYHYGLYNDIAGKTGTTQNHADGWFMGATPHLVTGVWVGADDPGIHFRTLDLGQGAATALPIYGLFMQKVAKDPAFRSITRARFPEPSLETRELLDCEPFKEKLDSEKGIFNVFDNLFKRSEPDPPRYPEQAAEKKQKKKRGFFQRLFGGKKD